MSSRRAVSAFAQNAEQLEQVYHEAIKANEADAFQQAIEEGHAAAPENLLYAAWFYRLRYAAAQAKRAAVAWGWVLPLAILNGALFWWLSDLGLYTIATIGMPVLAIWAGPISAVCVLLYLTAVSRRRLGALIGIIVGAVAAYAHMVYPQAGALPFQEQYLILMVIHLPLLVWAGVGVFLTAGLREPAQRFAFLIKSLEVFILGGLFVAAGGLFVLITMGLFEALAVGLPEAMRRLLIVGGGGLIPVVAVAVIYNPRVSPSEQAFHEGLSRLIALLMRILLPLTLLVLAVYLVFIPFNFTAAFERRDVLIIYNGMLFAVAALLVGATPVSIADVSPRLGRWLRRGIMGVAILALLVGLYALAAIVYRTTIDRLTPNRLTFIGWNVINIALLILALSLQVRARGEQWLQRLHRAFSAGTVAYTVWTLVVVLALPWLFGLDQASIATLPPEVQDIAYEHPAPILLQCGDSPHIYLLERGQKRWIETIETFSARGYAWRDVHTVTCDALRGIPDGIPIPADAGPPPQP